MHLPHKIIPYFLALLSAPWRFNIGSIALFAKLSHDSLTRALGKKYSWKEYFFFFLNKLDLDSGYIIVDETDIDKSYAKIIGGLSWIFSHRKNKFIFGYHLVVVVWTNSAVTIPIGWKIYSKKNGKTKTDLAVELFDYCINTLRIKPLGFLFDSFYASDKIMMHLHTKGFKFYSQCKKTRVLNKTQVKDHHGNKPYWTETGKLKEVNLTVQVVRHRRKYFITNDLEIDGKKQRTIYKIRWKIEEVFRFVKSELGLERCECRSLQKQNNHFGVCFLLFSVLQDISLKTKLSLYSLKQNATLDRKFLNKVNIITYLEGA